jgi:hypothetical protein
MLGKDSLLLLDPAGRITASGGLTAYLEHET